ncbi:MAG: tetratricopeptide repeat protein [Bernardetiaceae bacterium]|nr:tetratricopeptide repeat protein [Bernardetiaceae bacterium]
MRDILSAKALRKGVNHIVVFWLSSHLVQCIIISLLTIGIYANSVFNDYATDGARLLSHNPRLLDTEFSTDGIMGFFMRDAYDGIDKNERPIAANEHYQPLTMLSFAIEYRIFGEHPYISHSINLILYVLTGLLLLLVLERMLYNFVPERQRHLLSFVATLIFMAHPVHTEIVASVKGRNELLSFLLLLVMVLVLLREAVVKSVWVKVLLAPVVASLFLLALLTEEAALGFMVVIPLIFYFFTNLRKRVVLLFNIPIILTAIGYWYLRRFFVSEAPPDTLSDVFFNPFAEATLGEYIGSFAFAMGRYLLKLGFPFRLSHDYTYNAMPLQAWYAPWALISLIVCTAAIIWAVSKSHKRNIYAFAILFFMSYMGLIYIGDYIINPREFLFLPTGSYFEERLLYVPSLAFSIAVAFATYELSVLIFKRKKQITFAYKYVFLGTLFILMLYAWRTVERNQDWASHDNIIRADIKVAPNSIRLNTAYTEILIRDADSLDANENERKNLLLSEAEQYAQHAISIDSSQALPYILLGEIYKRKGDIQSAISYYQLAAKFAPNDGNIYKEKGFLMVENKEYRNANIAFLEWFKKDKTMEAFLEIGKCYEKLFEPDSALLYYQTYLQKHEEDAWLQNQIGKIYAKKGNFEKAEQHFYKAAKNDKYFTEVYKSLSDLHLIRDDISKAKLALEQGIAINPKALSLYQAMISLTLSTGDSLTAESYQVKADLIKSTQKNKAQ